jgi:Ca2+-binding EF-hand superfamily protein
MVFFFFKLKALRGELDDPIVKKATHDALTLLFRIVDTNSNGFISHEDFQFYFQSLGITDNKFTSEIFKAFIFNNHNFSINEEGKLFILSIFLKL